MSHGLAFLRIRTKLILILVMAAVLPVCIAVFVLETLGYKSYRDAQGRLYEAKATHLSMDLENMVRQELESLDDWISLSNFHLRVERVSAALERDSAAFTGDVEAVDARWRQAGPDDILLGTILTNEASAELDSFRSLHPMFAEIFVTDAKGRVVGSTEKTTDFWQADEDWWQQGMVLPSNTDYVQGIEYDASAGVHSLNAAVAIRDRTRPDAPVIGVLKAVLNVSSLFSHAQPLASAGTRQVIVSDGRVLATLGSRGEGKPLERRINPGALKTILEDQSGWMICNLDDTGRDLVGFSPLHIDGQPFARLRLIGATPMFMLVRQPAAEVLLPVRQQMILLGVGGGLCLLAFVAGGYFVATHKLITPIEQMREAVRRVAESVTLERSTTVGATPPAVIEPLKKIQTRDELEDLAGDFAGMANRVLGYNEQLEREIAAKTAEISRDLQLAREFQEALMPTSFPKVPSEPALAPLSVSFRHLYKPALSVGGDFFDVMKLDDHKAGVFIADVMGHGARSALVTAILRTLILNVGMESAEPAEFLSTLNKLFHNSIRNSGDTIFVSAFYMVVDTREATARFASAGHPSPYLANRESRTVKPLFEHLHGNPALGVLPDAHYQQWNVPMRAGDLFVLFTDGVHEAYRDDGEEFGMERIRQVIRSQLGNPTSEVPTAIVSELQRFIAPAQPADDICIVSLEVKSNAAVAEAASAKAAPVHAK